MPDITIGRLRGGLCAAWRDPATGRRRRYQLEARTRADAEAEALRLYRRLNPPPVGQTVAELWEAYQEERDGRQIATAMRYSGKSLLPHFGAYTPDQITTQMCRGYIAARRDKGIKDGSIWTELGHLRSVLNWAAKRGRIARAPYIERPPKPAPKDRWLTHVEIAALLAAATAPHIKLAILLMLSTAGRVGAILELTWDRVDLDRA